jgi:DNA-binding LacI/PurR family transcriptional regulator
MAAPVEHLVELDHKRIAFFGGRADFEHVQERLDRFCAALERVGLEPGPVVHAGADLGADALSVLDGSPSAVVCASDVLALAVVVAARSRGLSVPDDLSVTGFDDSPLAALATPGLTSVRVDYAEFGEAATGALLAAIGVGEPSDYSPSAPELVVRASTARRRRR